MNQIDLAGQVAVVTGGAQGLGFAIAQRLVTSGAKVSLWDRDADVLQQAKAALGEAASGVVVDITDLPGLTAAHAQVEADVGKVSILVNSAGIAGTNATLEDYDPEEWRRVVEINLNGTFYVNKVVIASMKAANYGRIVNISSVRQGGQSQSVRLFGRQGRRHRPDQGIHRLHAGAHPARPLPRGRRGRQYGGLAGLQGEQLHHRIGLRPLWRPHDLLGRRP